ncbi:hypothetical protein LAZ67_10000975 [Cordylochernes scorpioides]|uniref:Uncharacterized protein n=1 Tax=Cordylochernes scorpioides TaxID=51811 RepID=A0ABY6KVF6_9ARAC|nr:hypothetical protein LAZ67_10000975 [Cordylochernes scorpioides]
MAQARLYPVSVVILATPVEEPKGSKASKCIIKRLLRKTSDLLYFYTNLYGTVICAEFPDPIQDPLLYNIVVKNMIHGPCGEYNPVSPCMKNSSCSKKYPKQFLLETQTNVLQARILTGSFRGEEVLIPRIPIIPNDLPFKFRRLQFSVMVAFAMTINKSQGQTLQVVGVHLESPCFSHGQLYVACSRVSSPKNLVAGTEGKKKSNAQPMWGPEGHFYRRPLKTGQVLAGGHQLMVIECVDRQAAFISLRLSLHVSVISIQVCVMASTSVPWAVPDYSRC